MTNIIEFLWSQLWGKQYNIGEWNLPSLAGFILKLFRDVLKYFLCGLYNVYLSSFSLRKETRF